jgi:ferric-dicitrate binding protein FerR (iron transport regulator)
MSKKNNHLANTNELNNKQSASSEIDQKIDLLKQMEQIDSQKAYQQISKRIEKHHRKISIKLVLVKAAAVVLIPLLAFSVWQGIKLNQLSKTTIVENQITTPATLRSTFLLPDGTKVWLNGTTSLIYPTQFSGNERLVELNGEAFFEVAKNQKPFRVKMGNVYVEAVGTAFNCKAFENDQKTEILLTQGKVNLLIGKNNAREQILSLTPNQLATYNKADKKITRKTVDPVKYTAWREGKIIFKNDNLHDVLLHLERWYNVSFEIDVKIKGDYAFTGSFNGEELSQILNYIELTTPVRFEIMKDEIDANQLLMKKKIKIKPLS